MEPKISIIVPVYNVEKYLRRCIESILNQTFKEFELILVNDGSPDNCGEICNEYAKKDKRIVVIHKKNEGCSAARNSGLNIAKGEYIGFVDSDDWIESNMYEEMYTLITKEKSDLVQCGFIEHNSYLQSKKEILCENGDFFPAIWCKIFKKSIINRYNLSFPINTHCGEDLVFTEKYLSLIQSMSYLQKAFYNYDLGEESVSLNLKKRLEIYKSLNEIIRFKKNIKNKKLDKKLENIILNHGFEYPIKLLRNTRELNIKLEKFIAIMYLHILKYWKYLSFNNKIYLFKIITKVYIENKFKRG